MFVECKVEKPRLVAFNMLMLLIGVHKKILRIIVCYDEIFISHRVYICNHVVCLAILTYIFHIFYYILLTNFIGHIRGILGSYRPTFVFLIS